MQSTEWMDRALALAARGRGLTAPNPAVGAVLVRDGQLLGEGWHRGPGRPHAEAAALDDARNRGHSVRGATLYVTLEPCCHTGPGKRTPPCAQRLVAEGIGAVWAGVPDPNPQVSGRGRTLLEQAGIRFAWGPRSEAAGDLIADFSAWVANRPFVTLKWAQSLDGRLVGRAPGSRWITGAEARLVAHRLRADHDAVMVGAGTLRTDDPELTVRDAPVGPGGPPRRLVIAGASPLPTRARLFRDDHRSLTWLVAAPASPAWVQAPALVGDRKIAWDGADLGTLHRRLLEAGFHRILVEGGPKLLSTYLTAGVWDRMEVFTAPLLLGGMGNAAPSLPMTLARSEWRRCGSDMQLGAWNPRLREAACSPV